METLAWEGVGWTESWDLGLTSVVAWLPLLVSSSSPCVGHTKGTVREAAL